MAAHIDFLGKTALVVDDEPFSRAMVRKILEGLGVASILEAKSGHDAVRFLKKGGPNIDFVICDFRMPVRNGLELLKALRMGKGGLNPQQRFAMLTGFGDEKLVAAALALDVDAFLIKPLSKKAVINRVARVLSSPVERRSAEYYARIPIPTTQPMEAVEGGRAVPEKPKPAAPTAPPPPPQPEEDDQAQYGGTPVTLFKIPAGSELARDIKDVRGNLLLARGNVLGGPLISRLQDLEHLLPEKVYIKETEAAEDS